MTTTDLLALRNAIEILETLLPVSLTVSTCPVMKFVRTCLIADSADNTSSEELLAFFQELAGLGAFPPLSPGVFYRRLGPAIYQTFGIRRSHDIRRKGKSVRGFNSVSFAADDLIIARLGLRI
jgi:hypothetical protein